MQTAKALLKKCQQDNEDIQIALLAARNISRLGLHSAVRLFGRPTRTTLPTAHTEKKADTRNALEEARWKQNEYADRIRPGKLEFSPSRNVRIRTGHRQRKGGTVVTNHETPRSVIIKTSDGSVLRRNNIDIHRTVANLRENER